MKQTAGDIDRLPNEVANDIDVDADQPSQEFLMPFGVIRRV